MLRVAIFLFPFDGILQEEWSADLPFLLSPEEGKFLVAEQRIRSHSIHLGKSFSINIIELGNVTEEISRRPFGTEISKFSIHYDF